jgi:hypothetical protein
VGNKVQVIFKQGYCTEVEDNHSIEMESQSTSVLKTSSECLELNNDYGFNVDKMDYYELLGDDFSCYGKFSGADYDSLTLTGVVNYFGTNYPVELKGKAN